MEDVAVSDSDCRVGAVTEATSGVVVPAEATVFSVIALEETTPAEAAAEELLGMLVFALEAKVTEDGDGTVDSENNNVSNTS